MVYRNCPIRASIGCAACRGQGTLTDRKGITFPVECGQRQYSQLLNSIPLHIAERDNPGDFRLLYFTREDKADCQWILEDFRLNRKAATRRTGGLYYRELL
jgi:putative protease